ncbi:MAG: DUF4331 family protein [Gemmatimonadetes bacterium]|nr:DUF4331 family protein [Gemmatimonadota bacterium]
MLHCPLASRLARMAVALAITGLGAGVALRTLHSSDHQDTPEVELSPRMDVNDVYAFPGSGTDRIVLVMTTSSPITPAQSAGAAFDPDLLYQIKIDNDDDAVEDLVIQATFNGSTAAGQTVELRGPVAPDLTGMRTTLVDVEPAVTGAINTTLGSSGGIQVFAGVRDDPFFLDLEQFFCIIPDRRPATGPLSGACTTGVSNGFRPAGQAVDYLAGYNTLAIVIELPESMLTAGGTSKLGIWGTISR